MPFIVGGSALCVKLSIGDGSPLDATTGPPVHIHGIFALYYRENTHDLGVAFSLSTILLSVLYSAVAIPVAGGRSAGGETQTGSPPSRQGGVGEVTLMLVREGYVRT